MSKIDKWNARYRTGEHASQEPSPLLVGAVGAVAPGRALDLACGTGANALYLAAHGWSVVAVDGSCEAIAIARRAAAAGDLTIDARVADLESERIDFRDGSFDLVTIFFFLWRPLLAEARRLLRPGGLFVSAINTVDHAPDARPMNAAFLLERGELGALFGDWNIGHEFEGRRPGHNRAVAEIVARKPDAWEARLLLNIENGTNGTDGTDGTNGTHRCDPSAPKAP